MVSPRQFNLGTSAPPRKLGLGQSSQCACVFHRPQEFAGCRHRAVCLLFHTTSVPLNVHPAQRDPARFSRMTSGPSQTAPTRPRKPPASCIAVRSESSNDARGSPPVPVSGPTPAARTTRTPKIRRQPTKFPGMSDHLPGAPSGYLSISLPCSRRRGMLWPCC
jgi:hypothetical protein